MKRILAVIALALLVASCSKVGQKFEQSGMGSSGAASTGAGGNSGSAGGTSTTTTGTTASADVTDGAPVEQAVLTDAQRAALEGGQEIKWDQQGMSWTVPKGWVQGSVETKNFNWHSARGGDLSSLIAYVSPMAESFPTDVALKAAYTQSVDRKKNGELEDVRWLEIDGVKGVATLEAMPEGKEDPRRLLWTTYRKFAGQSQLVTMMLATAGRNFEKNKDTFYGILYSTKLVH